MTAPDPKSLGGQAPSYVEMTCQFCGEADFDDIGLKIHLTMAWCEVFNAIPATDAERGALAAAPKDKP